MHHAQNIIQRFGGIRPLATALGHRNPTTVQGWKKRDFIPVEHWPSIIALAKHKSIAIDLADLARIEAE